MVGTVRRITIRRGNGSMSPTCIVKLVEDQAHVMSLQYAVRDCGSHLL